MILRVLLALWTSLARQMGDHLWQSTVFVGLVAILALALRKNQAKIRYWVWLTASVKFLIPFSLLIALGSHFAKPRVSTPAQAVLYSAVEDFSQPFAGPEMLMSSAAAPSPVPVSRFHLLPPIIVAVWLTGIIIVLLVWATGWVRVSLMVCKAASTGEGPEVDAFRRLKSSLGVRTSIRLVLSPDSMEPGIFGIFRTVLIWPEGISQHLDDRHIDAILAHEICHVRRHDNLTAMLHMLVEAVFWFHPLVWWMGARLEDERERSCDEEVSLLCDDPHVYAESILKVCKFCSESPLACVSGITGADLKKRIMQIMTERVARKLDLGRKLLLLAVAVTVVAAPLVLGLVHMPVVFGQVLNARGPHPFFEAASIHAWKQPAPPPETVGGEQMIHQETADFSPGNVGGQTSDRGHIIAPSGVLIAQAYGPPPGSDGRADGRLDAHPGFEVATIKPSDPKNCCGYFWTVDGMRFRTGNTNLRWLIRFAYGLNPKQIIGEPAWAGDQLYDVTGAFAGTKPPTDLQCRVALQLLLTERFGLKFHQESREMSAYVLTSTRGSAKLTSVDPKRDNEPELIFSRTTGQTMHGLGRDVSLHDFATEIQRLTLDRPLVDRTGITGKFDIDLEFTWEDPNSLGLTELPEDAAPNLLTALNQQLGLKLEVAKAPVDVMVIDDAKPLSAN